MVRKLLGTAATVLIVAAVLGLACWFAFSAATGATLVTFRTGSMSPTMPQGAVAVTLPTPADALRVGDVVTVQRANEPMPVTHRVIEIREVAPQGEHAPDLRAAMPGGRAPDPRDPAAREIVMQGDDNDIPDHLPYVVTEVRRTVFAAPHVGTALTLLQTPIGAGAMVLGVGALVTWAFWPRRDDEDPDPDRGDGPGREPGDGSGRDREPVRAPRHAAGVLR